MSSEKKSSNRMDAWEELWDKGQTDFHRPDIHPALKEHFKSLIPDGNVNKIFVPLCGKSLDMKWLADQGISVVGLDGAALSLKQFFEEQNLPCVQEDFTLAGENCKVFKSADDRIKLYCCDMMNFNESVEGTFGAVWDRGSLVALNREDVPGYVKLIKSLMSQGGRCMLEVLEYSDEIMKDLDESHRPPPPYSMLESELKTLYEPECSVELLERKVKPAFGKEIEICIYLITKK